MVGALSNVRFGQYGHCRIGRSWAGKIRWGGGLSWATGPALLEEDELEPSLGLAVRGEVGIVVESWGRLSSYVFEESRSSSRNRNVCNPVAMISREG